MIRNHYLSSHYYFHYRPEVKGKKHPWWALHRPRSPVIFSSPKFIGLTTSKTIELIYDEQDHLCVTDAMYVFAVRDGIDPFAVMALMQSRVFLALYRVSNLGEARVIPQIKAAKLEPIPFPICASGDKLVKAVSTKASELLLIRQGLATAKAAANRAALVRQCDILDKEIDILVSNLYGLTRNETEVLEAQLRT
jgi:hypothetical protein